MVNRSMVATITPSTERIAGVIPVIFSVSFIMAPRTIAGFLMEISQIQLKLFRSYKPIGMIIYVV